MNPCFLSWEVGEKAWVLTGIWARDGRFRRDQRNRALFGLDLSWALYFNLKWVPLNEEACLVELTCNDWYLGTYRYVEVLLYRDCPVKKLENPHKAAPVAGRSLPLVALWLPCKNWALGAFLGKDPNPHVPHQSSSSRPNWKSSSCRTFSSFPPSHNNKVSTEIFSSMTNWSQHPHCVTSFRRIAKR